MANVASFPRTRRTAQTPHSMICSRESMRVALHRPWTDSRVHSGGEAYMDHCMSLRRSMWSVSLVTVPENGPHSTGTLRTGTAPPVGLFVRCTGRVCMHSAVCSGCELQQAEFTMGSCVRRCYLVEVCDRKTTWYVTSRVCHQTPHVAAVTGPISSPFPRLYHHHYVYVVLDSPSRYSLRS